MEEATGVRDLPVLDQPEVVPCCAPLASQEVSERDAATLALQFAALADPVRLRLVSLLATAEGGAVCACDLVEPSGRSQATVSFHLGKLQAAGLVVSEKRGRNVWYAVVPAGLEALRGVLAPRWESSSEVPAAAPSAGGRGGRPRQDSNLQPAD